jgi:hypothetical protein
MKNAKQRKAKPISGAGNRRVKMQTKPNFITFHHINSICVETHPDSPTRHTRYLTGCRKYYFWACMMEAIYAAATVNQDRAPNRADQKVNMEQDLTFKNFRKFQTDSQMVSK